VSDFIIIWDGTKTESAQGWAEISH